MLSSPTIRLLRSDENSKYFQHLHRLDTASRFTRFNRQMNDQTISEHCLSLIADKDYIVGAFVGDVLRGGAEIVCVDLRNRKKVELAISVEKEFRQCHIGLALFSNVIKLFQGFEIAVLCRPDNGAMVGLASKFGRITSRIDDYLMFSFNHGASNLGLGGVRGCRQEDGRHNSVAA